MPRPVMSFAAYWICSSALAAPTLFAVDAPTGTLVRVNAATGYIVEVGVINLGVGTGAVTDLASDGGRLFVLNSIYPNGAFIGEVNPGTAATLSSAQVTEGGSGAVNAIESLSTDQHGNLIVALWQPGSPGAASSNNLGVLTLTGEVTGVVNLGPSADFDGLGRDPNGDMVGLNREPGPNYVQLLNVSHTPPGQQVIVTLPFSGEFNLVDDCAVLGGDIITMDRDFKRLNRHDRATGQITSFVNYTADYSIYIMTVVDVCAGDVDGDGFVGFADLNLTLGAFNSLNGDATYDGSADQDIDGDVDFADLNLVLSGFNAACP